MDLKRWSIVASIYGVETTIVVRGFSEAHAKRNAIEGYKGIGSAKNIISITERSQKRQYQVSMEALKKESNVIPRLLKFK
jgi:hypothetical protein